MALIYPTENARLIDYIDAVKKFKALNLKAVNADMQKCLQNLELQGQKFEAYGENFQEKIESRAITAQEFIDLTEFMAIFEKTAALILANYDAFSRLNNDPQIVSKVMKILYGRAG